MAKANFVKKARKAKPEHGIGVGDSYWWWQLFKRPRQVSKTKPKLSQLTGSIFLSTVYAFTENPVISIVGLSESNESDIHASIEERMTEVEELKDEQQEKLENMPYQLQYAPSGELLQSRIDSLEGLYDAYEVKKDEWDDDWSDDEREDFLAELHEICYEGE